MTKNTERKLTEEEEKIFNQYSPVVIMMADKLYDQVKEQCSGVIDADDLYQVGFIALLKGVKWINMDKIKEKANTEAQIKAKIEHLLYPIVKCAMLDEIACYGFEIAISRRARQKYNGKSPKNFNTIQEQIFCKRVNDFTLYKYESIEEMEEEPYEFAERMGITDKVALEQLRKDIYELFESSRLTQRDVKVLKDYFGLEGEPKNMSEIARELDRRPEAVRQAINRALEKMKHPFRRKSLKEYL